MKPCPNETIVMVGQRLLGAFCGKWSQAIEPWTELCLAQSIRQNILDWSYQRGYSPFV